MNNSTPISYDRWYRKRGVWNFNHLRSPNIFDYNKIKLPLKSIYHYVDYNNVQDIGPDFSEPIIKNSARKIFVDVTKDLSQENKGGYVHIEKPVMSLVTQYYKEHPKIYRPQKPIYLYEEIGVLPVYSYGLIDNTHVYRKNRFTEMKRWFNYYKTVFEKAKNVGKETNKQQFIELEIPSVFPTRQNLLKCEKGIDESMINLVNHKDMWLIIEFWNLLGQTGGSYVFKNYEMEDFKTINILWRFDNKYICMNLGRLLNYAHGEKPQIQPLMLQRLFLRLMINLKAARDNGEAIAITDELDGVTETAITPRFSVSAGQSQNEGDDEEPTGQIDDGSEEEVDDEDETSGDESSSSEKADGGLSKSEYEKQLEALKKAEQNEEYTNADEMGEDSSNGNLDDENDNTIFAEDDGSEEETEKLLDVVGEDTSEQETAVYKEYTVTETKAEDVIADETLKLVKAGVMSPGSRQRLIDLTTQSYKMTSPMSKHTGKTIAESLVVNKEDVVVEDKNKLPVESLDILDESMVYSSMNKMTEQYIDKVLDKDVLAMVMNLQKGGLVVKNYEVEEVENINDHFNIHKVQIETIKGHTSTLAFKLPVIKKDGTFKSSSTKRRLRTQRADIPIRKVDSNSVALTSYYSKMFVNRSERKQFSLEDYVVSEINISAMDVNGIVKDVKLSNVFENTVKLPRHYSVISKAFSQFKVKDFTLHFDYNNIDKNFTNYKKSKNLIPLAVNEAGETTLYISLTNENMLFDSNLAPLGLNLFQYIGINENMLPLEYAEVNIFGKKIPLFLFLGHYLGFGSLLKTLKLKPRREAKGKRLVLADGEYAFKFSDETLIFNRKTDPLKSTLIINGLARYKNLLKQISVYDLDNKSIYSDMFDEIKAPIKLLKESKDMFNLWVDPITEQILKDMGEPIDLVLLFIRACELLTNDEHPDAMDTLYMRDRGYERIAGILYGELTKAVREYNSKPIYNNTKLTINPESVWFNIITDQTQTLIEESNPVHNLKEKDVVVYSGYGGRSGDTMMAGARKFHKNSIGTTAENTVDSGDAGVILYRTADPSYTSVYGITKKQDIKDVSTTRTFSNSLLLAPGAVFNDAKRTNFISVQQSQTTYCDGYTPMPLRTGMEKTIHAKTGETFSMLAEENGKVVNVTKDGIVVDYESGKRVGYKLGKFYGKWAGDNIPHEVVTDFKKGDTFKAGDCIYYNKNYFVRDVTDRNNVMFKNFALTRVAFVENFDVYEDSCAMSKKFSSKLTSKLGHIRNVRINTEQTIKNLVNIGDSVETDSILCTIHSAQFGASVFGEDSMKALESIAALNPKAQNKGVIEDIKVIYSCELDEMSDELRELVAEADNKLYKLSNIVNSKINSGKVNPGFLVDGVGLADNEIVFQIYITETADMSVADKVVIGNQLKSTVGRYWSDPITSEDGVEIDVLFGANSVDNRIVLDCELIGTTNSLLVALSKEVVKAYNK